MRAVRNLTVVITYLGNDIAHAINELLKARKLLLRGATCRYTLLDFHDKFRGFMRKRVYRSGYFHRSAPRIMRQLFDLSRHNRECLPGGTCLFRLNRGVERQHVSRARNRIDRLRHPFNLLHCRRKTSDMRTKAHDEADEFRKARQ